MNHTLNEQICALFFKNLSLETLFSEAEMLFACKLACVDEDGQLLTEQDGRSWQKAGGSEIRVNVHSRLRLRLLASRKLPSDAFETFGQIAALTVRQDPASFSACGYRTACLLRRLLDGKAAEADVPERLRGKRISLLCLIPDAGERALAALQKTVQDTYRRPDTLRGENCIWVVLSDESERQTCAWTETLLQTHGAAAGLSESGSSVLALPRLHVQAESAISVGRQLSPQRRLFCYRDYAVFHMLRQLPDEKTRRMLCAPEVAQLKAYDLAHKTAYLETLEAYLRNNRKCRETAQQLHISESTLHYRLERLRGLLKTCLADADSQMTLQLSLAVLRYEKGGTTDAALHGRNGGGAASAACTFLQSRHASDAFISGKAACEDPARSQPDAL